MNLSSAAEITGGVLIGVDQKFIGVNTDTRQLTPGELFVAIPGENFDGHDFLGAALQRGAVGALVEHAGEEKISQLMVDDTTVALGKLAQSWRSHFNIPVIGITGSNGKTTVTAMVREILSVSHNPLYPLKSFNNQWGVPLTLLKLRDEHTHAVIEMGMNSAGEIDYLSRIARPTIALINNAAAAHLQGLGSVRQVALAKAEILSNLGSEGVAVLNADDASFELWRTYAGERKMVSFGLQNRADVTATEVQLNSAGSTFCLQAGGDSTKVSLSLAGRHNVMNALAAAAACIALDIDLEQIAKGLRVAEGIAGRLSIFQTNAGAKVIDDSFNANPASTKAAIDVLASHEGKRVLVLGAMAELGAEGEALHAEVGKAAAVAGIDRMVVLADSGNADVKGYLRGYGSGAECFDDIEELIDALMSDDLSGTTLLVKGSKSSRMGRVVERLLAQKNNNGIPESVC
ncbi:MAG: UDP-N-acetylmuramoyl-tripeptide--D-alanyl-D-alanine ligase [Gammaproteobacteria bacterium]